MDTTTSIITSINEVLNKQHVSHSLSTLPEITKETKLEDIGLDSLDKIEVMMELEIFYHISFTNKHELEWDQAKTVEDWTKVVDELISKNNS